MSTKTASKRKNFPRFLNCGRMQGAHPYYYLLDLTKRIEQPGIKAKDLVPHVWKEKFEREAMPQDLRDDSG